MSRLALLILIIVAIAVRCWEIDAAFVDQWSWRQSDVAGIARNYFENGFHFTRPQIDWAGDQAGFVGTEFPILPFAAAVAYKFFGVHEWIGRVQSILFFGFSLPFFWLIVRRGFDMTAAGGALVFYAFAPLSIAASRAFMPDMASLALALAGFYFFWRAVAAAVPGVKGESSAAGNSGSWNADSSNTANHTYINRRKYHFLLASVTIALSLLIKPPMIIIAAPITAVAWQKFGRKIFLQPNLWFFAAITLIPSAIWYWHAYQIAQQFYPYHLFGAGGVRVMNLAWYWRVAVQTFSSTLTPIVFLLAIAGVFLSRKNKNAAPFRWWLMAMIGFIVIVGYGNRHQWYQLPLVPIAAGFSGAALSWATKKWSPRIVIPTVVIPFLVLSLCYSRQYFRPTAEALRQLGHELNERTVPGALIIAADDGDPTAFYYAHRKGWHLLERHGLYNGNPTESAQIIADVQKLRGRGATHLVFYRGTMWWLDYYKEFSEYLTGSSKLVSATSDYRLYELSK